MRRKNKGSGETYKEGREDLGVLNNSTA